MSQNEAQAQTIPLDLTSAEDVTCEKCESNYFQPVFVIKQISALISPNGQEGMMPVQTFRCADCGNVNEKFVPKNN